MMGLVFNPFDTAAAHHRNGPPGRRRACTVGRCSAANGWVFVKTVGWSLPTRCDEQEVGWVCLHQCPRGRRWSRPTTVATTADDRVDWVAVTNLGAIPAGDHARLRTPRWAGPSTPVDGTTFTNDSTGHGMTIALIEGVEGSSATPPGWWVHDLVRHRGPGSDDMVVSTISSPICFGRVVGDAEFDGTCVQLRLHPVEDVLSYTTAGLRRHRRHRRPLTSTPATQDGSGPTCGMIARERTDEVALQNKAAASDFVHRATALRHRLEIATEDGPDRRSRPSGS